MKTAKERSCRASNSSYAVKYIRNNGTAISKSQVLTYYSHHRC